MEKVYILFQVRSRVESWYSILFRFICKNTLEKRIQKFGLTFVFSMYLSIVIYDALKAFFNFGLRLLEQKSAPGDKHRGAMRRKYVKKPKMTLRYSGDLSNLRPKLKKAFNAS
jgi:hypothetical protein